LQAGRNAILFAGLGFEVVGEVAVIIARTCVSGKQVVEDSLPRISPIIKNPCKSV